MDRDELKRLLDYWTNDFDWPAQQARLNEHAHLHRTKPQTLAVGLNDSPAGLLAWIAEKFMA